MPAQKSRLSALALSWWLTLAAGVGCATQPVVGTVQNPYPPNALPPVVVENPIHVPAANPDVLWEVMVDVVDDYFRIAREERVRQVGAVLTEGRLDTYPQTGATLFEPWRKDTVGRFQQLESTLQSIRRRAQVRVVPEASGYQVEVRVEKELEDVERPEGARTSPVAIGRKDTLDRRTPPLGSEPGTPGWIPQGRDVALEQTILAQLRARLGAAPRVAAPAVY